MAVGKRDTRHGDIGTQPIPPSEPEESGRALEAGRERTITSSSAGEQIVGDATIGASNSVMTFLSVWTSIRREDDEQIRRIRNQCVEVASRFRAGKLSPDECLQNLHTIISRTLETIVDHRNEVDLSDWTPASWRESVPMLPPEAPDAVSLDIPEGFWNSSPEDSSVVRRRKFLERLVQRFGRRRPARREFSLSAFVEFYVRIPFGLLLLEEWHHFLRRRSVDQHKFQQNTLDLLADLVHLAASEKGSSSSDELGGKIDSYLARHATPPDTSDPEGDERRRRYTQLIASILETNKQAWEHAGTALLPSEEVETGGSQAWTRIEEQYDRGSKAWQDHTVGSQEDLQHDLNLLLTEIDAVMMCRESIQAFMEKIRDRLGDPLTKVGETISRARENLTGDPQTPPDELRKRILEQNRTLVRALRNEQIPAIQEGMDAARLPKVIENLLSRIEHRVGQLPEQCQVFDRNGYDELIPDSTFIEIPMKNLVSTEVVPPLAKELDETLVRAKEQFAVVRRDVGELDQAIAFHLEAALELLGTGEAEGSSQEAAAQGLARTEQITARIIAEAETIGTETSEALAHAVANFIRRVHSFTDNERVIALRAKIIQSRVKGEVGEYSESVLGSAKKALLVSLAFLNKSTGWLKERLSRFRKAAGLTAPSKEEEADLASWINTTRVRINSLPFPYRRLFRVEPLKDEIFFGGRHEDLRLVEEDFRSWMNTRVGAVALVGEKGSGKTTILHRATRSAYRSLPVQWINQAGRTLHTESDLLASLHTGLGGDPDETLEELETRLTAMKQPQVVIVEDIQNLFMRRVGGFQALERLLLLISTTSHTVYWVVTCTRYTWRYFEKVLSISRFFRKELRLEGLDHDEIESIIMNRHRISGYSLRFEASPEMEQSKKYQQLATEEEKQAYLMEDCLDRMNYLAAGNITLAMLFWLTACKDVRDDTVTLSFEPPDTSALSQFPPIDLFTLAAALLHETLTAGEHALIFHQDHQESLLLLRRLVAKGLLVEQDNMFQVNTLLYRAAVRTLTHKNILH